MKPVRLIIVAVGGQGNLLAARVLGEAALSENTPVRMSEIHGMAQRGGVVESAMIFGDAESPIISDGCADVLLGFEPAETLRAMNRANPDTVVITNTAKLPPFTAAIGKGVYPELETIIAILKEKTKKVVAFDALELAKKANNPLAVNMVLLGALVASGTIPVSAEAVRKAIAAETKKAFVESNHAAFDLGFAEAK